MYIMKLICVVFCCIIYIVKAEENQKQKREVDLVLEGLTNQQWKEEEQECLKETLFILNNVKNYTVWAMWIWNSIERPVGTLTGNSYILGKYDQCMTAPRKAVNLGSNTQYCLARVNLTSRKLKWQDRNVMGDTETLISQAANDMNRYLSRQTWGVCLPAVCNPRAAAKVLKTIYMVNPVTPAEPTIEIEYCEIAGVKKEFNIGFYVFMSFIAILISTSVISTYLVPRSDPELLSSRIANSFCLRRNWISLTKKATSNDIPILNIVKISLSVFACGAHTLYFKMSAPIGNILDFDRLVSESERGSFRSTLTKGIPLAIDVFFFISGLLLIKGLMEKKKHPLVGLVNRYFRLMGIYALVTFYVAVVSIHMGEGPLWQRNAGREQKAASESWPWTLLMLNNFVNSKNISQIVAWYVPCDFQLSIFGTILYMLCQRNPHVGKAVTVLFAILAMLLPPVFTYWRNLPGTLFGNDFEQFVDFRKNKVFLETYIKCYHRAVPYLMGMGMGYIVSIYKHEKYRNVIPQKFSSYILVASFIMAYKVIIGASSWCLNNAPISTAIYVAFHKLIFTLAICLILVMIEYGSNSYARRIMEFHGFTVISRLSYGIYMTHSLFLQQNAFSRKNVEQFDFFTYITLSAGVVILSILTSTLLWFFVEAPLNNLVNLVTNSGYSRKEVRDTKLETRQKEIIASNNLSYMNSKNKLI